MFLLTLSIRCQHLGQVSRRRWRQCPRFWCSSHFQSFGLSHWWQIHSSYRPAEVLWQSSNTRPWMVLTATPALQFRLANWEGKMRCILHYHDTCDVGTFKTVDTFISAHAAPFMCAMCVRLCCVSVPWMIQSAPEKPFRGMNVGKTWLLFWPPQA